MESEIANRVFQQVMELWVLPEIEKRKKENRLESPFVLRKVQILFSHHRTFPKIRLNQQVKAIAKGKATRNIEKGEIVYEKDIENIEDIKLTEQDPNYAHITLLLFKGKWHISFDFRYNRKRVRERLDASKEFLESARENLESKRLRPFFENLFACAELLTEALLIQFLKQSSLKGHKKRFDNIKAWAELGNVKKEFPDKLEKLWKLRDSARYMSSTEFKKENPQEYLGIVDEMYDFVKKSIS
jgi:uncharacterized protein (UPF0332 family)